MKNINFKSKLKWLLPFSILIIVLFVIPFFFAKEESSKNNINQYKMELLFNDTLNILEGCEEVTYYNNSDNMFNSLYFHLYPNAFRQGAKNKVVSNNKMSECYPNGESYGEIEIKSCYFNDFSCQFEITGEDFNILKIDLLEPLYPDEKVEICIDFVTKLANINHRLGYGESTINLANFYPIACVYEKGKGFSQSLYHSNGDPFYSDCSDYEVSIDFNEKFQIASSGNLVESNKEDNVIKNKYKASSLRDFAIVLSEKFEVKSTQVDGVNIEYLGYQGDDNINKCLQVAVDSLNTFNKLFGKYPYKKLAVVKSNFLHGGMEYPSLVMISDKVAESDFEYVIVHEIAHQWWYAVVGNDEYNHAWQDEALAEYSTLMFYKENPQYGEDFDLMIKGANDSYKLFEEVYTKVQGFVDGKMDRPICDFQTEPEYVQCTYTKGVLMFNNIRQLIGDDKFLKALSHYYKDFMFKNATPEDLISIFIKYGGRKMENLFYSWLEGKVIFK